MRLQDLAQIALVFVIVTVIIAIGMDVSKDVQADMACGSTYTWVENTTYPDGQCCLSANLSGCNDTVNQEAFTIEGNATGSGLTGMSNLSEKLPIMATAVILAIIVGVLLKVFRVV